MISAIIGRIRGVSLNFPKIVAFLSVFFGIFTYAVLVNRSYLDNSYKYLLILINIDAILFLVLVVIVSRKLVDLWAARKRGLAGSRIHVKLVVFFSVLAIVPAIILAVFSTYFFNLGLQSWFSDRVETALTRSTAVADAYLFEHQKLIRAQVVSLAESLRPEASHLLKDRTRLSEVLDALISQYSLPEAIIIDARNNQVLARSKLTFTLEFELIPDWAFARSLDEGGIVMTNEAQDRVRALAPLDPMQGIFLYVGRFVDPVVLNHKANVDKAVAEYQILKGKRSSIEIQFSIIFIMISLLLLLVSIWIGLTFATQLSRPIRRLIVASERIRSGDLSTRIDEEQGEEELAFLVKSFNRMAGQLEKQRGELVTINKLIDERRQFIETVMAGVSAGVVGLDAAGRINLANQSASRLLGVALHANYGKIFSEIVPEFREWIERARLRTSDMIEAHVTRKQEAYVQTLVFKIVPESSSDSILGYVITFDDITELMSAQRKAAWSDVARRIAHEIKNPLTPIQLSAERLKRKYINEIKTDPQIFQACTETIVRQVEDIGRMVDEFSAFARMPEPVMKAEDLRDICEKTVFLQKSAHRDIVFEYTPPEEAIVTYCDRRLLTQALINILQNAIDAIEAKTVEASHHRGWIRLSITQKPVLGLVVEDNGVGLPLHDRERLTEPYVTTRTKGTGLGLAIVKKIMEDHQGTVALADREEGGARVSLTFGSYRADVT